MATRMGRPDRDHPRHLRPALSSGFMLLCFALGNAGLRRPTVLGGGNAPVAPLVLHGVLGGGNHLPSDDPHARLPYLFHKKNLHKISHKIL